MPITLNNSNISIQYNTGSNYIIETVKSDLYVRDTVGTTSNLFSEPTVSPTVTTNIAIFTHSGGAENQTPHTIYFPENTVCDILVVAGGGGAGNSIGAGGGAGGLVYITNYTLMAGTYNILVGKGGIGQVGQNTYSTEDGKNSTINLGATNIITALGGGTGQGQSPAYLGNNNRPGGSGAGATLYKTTGAAATQITGTTGISSTYGRGNAGGNSAGNGAAGGGGAGGVGGGGTLGVGGNGGVGFSVNITGTNVYYAGGGGGVSDINTTSGTGGLGGGGNGSSNGNGVSGTNGLGGGGGGGGSGFSGGNGGSGIVIIKVISPTTNKYLFFNYSSTQTNYTLTFPVRTLVDVNNNNNNLILQGQYNVSLGTANSSIIPSVFNTSNRLIPLPTASTSNVFVRYHTLNPIKTSEGAQWTYSSSNTNVYHLGSVGIGTTSPEYSLDIRGFVHTSVGGYTQTGTENWIIQSDRRIKENIVKASYEKCLENVKKVELYNFNFKENYVNTNDRNQLGFIAQEVQEVYPKAVIVRPDEEKGDLLTINTTQIKYTLYGAVKSLIDKVENLEMRVDKLYKIAIPDVDIIETTSNITEITIESTSNITIITSNISTSNIITSNISRITSN